MKNAKTSNDDLKETYIATNLYYIFLDPIFDIPPIKFAGNTFI